MNANYAAARYITCFAQSLSLLCGFLFRSVFFPETKSSREPDESWVNIVCLCRTTEISTMKPPITHEHFLDTNSNSDMLGAQYYIEETYRNYNHEDLGDEFGDPTYISPMELAEMQYVQACNAATRLLNKEPDITETVVWSRDTHRDEQIVRVWSTDHSSFPIIQKDVVYSTVEFLHVEYRHFKLGSAGIELSLPKQLMIVGNELFSPAFLYRWLKYFSRVPFVFDESYCLCLMDDNVNQHILQYGDYIVLGKTDIEVVRRNKPDADIEIENENENESISSSLEEEEEEEEEDEEEEEEEEEPKPEEEDEDEEPEPEKEEETPVNEDAEYQYVSNQV